MPHPDLSLSILKVSKLLQNKSLRSTDLCKMCLQRIKKISDLNAFITVTEQVAMKQSFLSEKRFQEGKFLGLLDGIPIAFKDNWCTKEIRTTCASKMLSNFYSPYNATAVQRLLDNGVTVIGKANLDEFAMGSATVDSYYGPTKNPWRSGMKHKLRARTIGTLSGGEKSPLEDENGENLDRKAKDRDFFVSGGSSGGAAAAVAAGACFGAVASDTGGSTRNPAAFCGIVGLKPTYGLVSRNGLIPLCNSLDVPGILARTIDDAALLLNAVAGPDPSDSTTTTQKFIPLTIPDEIQVRNLHVGIPKEYECPGMSSEVLQTWETVRSILERAGAKVTSVSLPHTKYSIMCYSVLCCCDVVSNFARYDGIRYGHRAKLETSEHHYAITRREGFGEVVRERILAGNFFLLKRNYDKHFLQAAKVRRLIYEDFQAVFESGVDLLLTPVTLTEPVSYSEWIRVDNREHNAVDDFCTQPVNMAGLPAVSFPCRLTERGLPVGLQLIGRPSEEQQMLTAAKWIEQQVQFPILQFEDS